MSQSLIMVENLDTGFISYADISEFTMGLLENAEGGDRITMLGREWSVTETWPGTVCLLERTRSWATLNVCVTLTVDEAEAREYLQQAA